MWQSLKVGFGAGLGALLAYAFANKVAEIVADEKFGDSLSELKKDWDEFRDKRRG